MSAFVKCLVLLVLAAATAPTSNQKAEEPNQPPARKEVRCDRYGDPLPEGVLTRLGSIRLRHAGTVLAAIFSPDRIHLVSGGRDDTIRLWDVVSGKERQRWAGQIRSARSLAYSPDGKILAWAGDDGVIRLWEATTGKEIRKLDPAAGRLAKQEPSELPLAFSSDSKYVALGGHGRKVTSWEVGSGKKVGEFTYTHGSVRSIAFLEGHKTVAVLGDKRSLSLWDMVSGKECREADRKKYVSFALSADGQTLAACGNGVLVLLDAASGKTVREFAGHQGFVWSVALSRDGKSLISGGADETIRIWDTTTGKEIRRFAADQGSIGYLSLAYDDKTFASLDGDAILLWDTTVGELRRQPGQRSDISAIAFAADGKSLAVGENLGTLHVWDLGTQKERCPGVKDVGPITFLSFHGEDRDLISASPARAVRVLLAATGKPIRSWGTEEITPVALSHSGKLLATGGGDQAIHLWTVSTGKQVRKFAGHGRNVTCLAWSADDKFLVSGASDRSIRLWDVASGKETKQLDPKNGVLTLACSPTGSVVACLGEDHVISFWCLRAGKEIRQCQGRLLDIEAIVFSPDGKVIASSGKQQPVRLWEVASGLERYRLAFHDDKAIVTALAFSPDGGTLATGSNDSTVSLWDTMPKPRDESTVSLDSSWNELASGDASRAFEAMRCMTKATTQSPQFLKERIRPTPAVNAQRIGNLLVGLDDKSFAIRQKAKDELVELGELAEPALQRMLEGKPALEARRRVEEILEELCSRPASPERLRALRALEILERIRTPEARRLLEELATGAPESQLTQEANQAKVRVEQAK